MAYLQQLKREATETYRMEFLAWASLAPHSKEKVEPPPLPEILRR